MSKIRFTSTAARTVTLQANASGIQRLHRDAVVGLGVGLTKRVSRDTRESWCNSNPYSSLEAP